jgi:hypothetical protein
VRSPRWPASCWPGPRYSPCPAPPAAGSPSGCSCACSPSPTPGRQRSAPAAQPRRALAWAAAITAAATRLQAPAVRLTSRNNHDDWEGKHHGPRNPAHPARCPGSRHGPRPEKSVPGQRLRSPHHGRERLKLRITRALSRLRIRRSEPQTSTSDHSEVMRTLVCTPASDAWRPGSARAKGRRGAQSRGSWPTSANRRLGELTREAPHPVLKVLTCA